MNTVLCKRNSVPVGLGVYYCPILIDVESLSASIKLPRPCVLQLYIMKWFGWMSIMDHSGGKNPLESQKLEVRRGQGMGAKRMGNLQ